MKIALVHLSDIHIQELKTNSVLAKAEKIVDALKNELSSVGHIFLMVSGDVAFSGKAAEYLIAETFLRRLMGDIGSYTSLPVDLLIIPGNHDCNFDRKLEPTREIILKALAASSYQDIDQYQLDICTTPQREYFDFVKRNGWNKGNRQLQDGYLVTSLRYELGDVAINFHCYNTSWHSRLHEEPGNMALPLSMMSDDAYNLPADLVVSLIHHPFNWQNPNNGREARYFLERTSDLIISGHEHVNALFFRKSDSGSTIYLEAGALQESADQQSSSFSLTIVDCEMNTIGSNSFNFDLKQGLYTKMVQQDEVSFDRRDGLKRREFEIERGFWETFLIDPGSKFMHSQTDRIVLSDIFIYPNLRRIYDVREARPRNAETLSGEQLAKSLNKDQLRLILVGEVGAGKTAYCKSLYISFWHEGYVPVYVNCNSIKIKAGLDGLIRLLKNQIISQYRGITEDIASQVDYRKVVLILDDFQLLQASAEGRAKFIHRLNKQFPHIILTGTQQLLFEPVTTINLEFVDAYSEYLQMLITEFGSDLRYSLINKWNRIGRIELVEENEILRLNDSMMSKVDSIIGKNFLPPYPVYLLTIIQTLEADSASNPDYSIQGYYYDFLISDSLNKVVKDKETISFYYNFVSDYAYGLFSERLRTTPVSRDYFERFFRNYSANYTISFSIELVLSNLKKARILTEDSTGNLSPSYNYVYYFFIARYLSGKIHLVAVRELVSKMCTNLYREEYSNIILFLVHLSKDPIVLVEILKVAKSLFPTAPLCQVDADVANVNELIQHMPEQVMELMDVDNARGLEYKHRADLENQLTEDRFSQTGSDEEEKDVDIDIDIIGKILFAFKAVDMLGQVTKKHWGDLPGPEKLELAQETYYLGLRTLTTYLGVLRQSSELLAEHIKYLVASRQMKDRDKIGQFSKDFMFRLSFMASFGIIKRISNSIGYNKLKLTFEEILQKNPYCSVDLIDLSIKLDHYSTFPMDDIERIQRATHEKNYLAWMILKNLVINYLYLFNTTPKIRQQLESLLGITIKNALAIDMTSNVKRE